MMILKMKKECIFFLIYSQSLILSEFIQKRRKEMKEKEITKKQDISKE